LTRLLFVSPALLFWPECLKDAKLEEEKGPREASREAPREAPSQASHQKRSQEGKEEDVKRSIFPSTHTKSREEVNGWIKSGVASHTF
jgi:hypothetical protein